MDNQRESRLLIPDDFHETNSEAIFKSETPTSSSRSAISTCNVDKHLKSKPKIYSFDLNCPDIKINEEKQSINPLFNCLNPKNFSFYHCFNKGSNNYKVTEDQIFCQEFSQIAPITKLSSEAKFSDTTTTNSVIYSSSHVLTENLEPKSSSIPSPAESVHSNLSTSSLNKPDLLTPDNFLPPVEKVSRTKFPNVPDISHDEPPAINSNNCTKNVYGNFKQCDEQSFIYFFNDKLNLTVIKKDNNVVETKPTSIQQKSCSDDEKHFNSILTPESFANTSNTSSVRRKLNFQNVNGNTENKAEAKKFPEFQCNLNITENIYEDLSFEGKANKTLFNLPFLKNPFPPIGVFWDIENCSVPKGLSATHVVQAIRNRFFDGYKEAEFICVCDTLKENPKVLEELNDAQVNIMHVGSIVKNAADDKLLQSMRRFADIHGAGASLILISGDSDFATELYDLRYRKRLHVILVHNAYAQDSLKLSAHETALFTDVTQELPQRIVKAKHTGLCKEITVWNIPSHVDPVYVKRRLHILSSNCGGKCISVQRHYARISFHTAELAARAKKRIEGEDVFGNRVNCTFYKSDQDWSRGRMHNSTNSGYRFGSRSWNSGREFDRREESVAELQPPQRLSGEEFEMDVARQG